MSHPASSATRITQRNHSLVRTRQSAAEFAINACFERDLVQANALATGSNLSGSFYCSRSDEAAVDKLPVTPSKAA